MLCDIPFEFDSILEKCLANGWLQLSSDDFVQDLSYVQFAVADDANITFLWDSELVGAIPLSTIFIDDVTLDPLIDESTWRKFDSTFLSAKKLCEAQLGTSKNSQLYFSDRHDRDFHYALFERHYSTLAVMQHIEGDGHLGHDASLDIRIIPMAADQIQFPLRTNLIF